MSAFANWPISRKLAVAFAAVIAVIFVSGAITYDRLRVIQEATNWRVRTANVLETLYTMTKATLDQEAGVRGYLVAGDKSFLEPYQRGFDAFAPALQKAKGLTSDDPAQQRRLNELNELANQWRGISEREIALMAEPETREAARAMLDSQAGKTAIDRIHAKMNEIAAVERDLLAKRDAVQRQA